MRASSPFAGSWFLVACWVAAPLVAQQGPPEPTGLRDLAAPGSAYRTPRSGEGVRASLFGDPIEIPARDRRSVRAWQVGVADALAADDGAAPLASLYAWEHPDERLLVRASLVGVYDQLTVAATAPSGRDALLTFENWTLPWATGEQVDGVVDDREELFWGYVRVGAGIGHRSTVAPGNQENQLASDLLVEPGVLYFGRGDRTDDGYQVPDSTVELRLRWLLRYDGVERNLLELAHAGVAFGADAVFGYRFASDAWGLPGVSLRDGDRHYAQATAYWFGITGLPGFGAEVAETNRVLASVHVGLGDGIDRFSAQRVGGGPDLRGAEFETSQRPWLPGAGYGEFFPDHYAIGSVGYRRELAFFAHLEVNGTVGWLDRDRAMPGGYERRDDTLVAVSAQVSTGFVGRTLLQVGYGHNFDVVRDGRRGGDEVTVLLTGRW